MFFAIFVLVVSIVDVFLSTEARGSYLDFSVHPYTLLVVKTFV